MNDKKTLYKKEIKQLRIRHNLYRLELLKLLDYHNNHNSKDGLIEFADPDEMILLCELLDVGYLDEDAIIVEKRNGDIRRVVFNKKYPLTKSGEAAIRTGRQKLAEQWKILLIIIIISVIITAWRLTGC